MEYYQARISIETAQLMEQVKRLYEIEKGVTITRADVLMNAYADSLWVTDWEKEVRNKKKEISIERIEITPSAQKLKVHISDGVEKGIKILKEEIPKQINARSVTYGVVIEYILLAAYIKLIQGKKKKKSSIIECYFKDYKEKLSCILKDNDYKNISEITEKLEKDLKIELEKKNLV